MPIRRRFSVAKPTCVSRRRTFKTRIRPIDLVQEAGDERLPILTLDDYITRIPNNRIYSYIELAREYIAPYCRKTFPYKEYELTISPNYRTIDALHESSVKITGLLIEFHVNELPSGPTLLINGKKSTWMGQLNIFYFNKVLSNGYTPKGHNWDYEEPQTEVSRRVEG